MHIRTVVTDTGPTVGFDLGKGRFIDPASLGLGHTHDLLDLFGPGVAHGTIDDWAAAAANDGATEIAEPHSPAPLVGKPSKIVGIGINYRAHGADLDAPTPSAPTFFIKGHHTIVGPGGPIALPAQSQDVTAEGELALVIGKQADGVSVDSAFDYVAGVCAALDQTAEDILRENTRFLTRAKNFPSFLCLSDRLVPIKEVLSDEGDLDHLVVGTYRNGELVAENSVTNMMFSPQYIVSFCSQVMPLFPGDIITTGTPSAAHISHGDTVEARVSSVGSVAATVERVGPRQ